MNRTMLLAAILWSAVALRLSYDVLRPNASPRPIAVPLSKLRADCVGPSWTGVDVELADAVRERAGVDDYVKRVYSRRNITFAFYVGYVGGFKPGAVHYPDVCNRGSGLVPEAERTVTIPQSGGGVDLVFSESIWRDPLAGVRVYTLSTFSYSGILHPSEVALRANSWRIPYFAVLTFQGNWLGSLDATREVYFDVARRAVPEILTHFPETRAAPPSRAASTASAMSSR